MQIYLRVQYQARGERKGYLPKEKEEGEADVMQKAFAQATVYLLSS